LSRGLKERLCNLRVSESEALRIHRRGVEAVSVKGVKVTVTNPRANQKRSERPLEALSRPL
jgi:hypothetical protein